MRLMNSRRQAVLGRDAEIDERVRDGFQEIAGPCQVTIAGYHQFQKETEQVINELQQRLEREWRGMEQKWWKWSVGEYVQWVRYKMKWFDEQEIPHYFCLHLKSNPTFVEQLEKKNSELWILFFLVIMFCSMVMLILTPHYIIMLI